MWNFIRECLERYPFSIIKDDEKSFYYKEFINIVEFHKRNLQLTLHQKSKCAILCDSQLNTVIGLLTCWSAGMVAIPLSKNYGIKHCEQIIDLTEPDLVITDGDNYKYKFIYNIKTNLLYLSTQNCTII